MSDRTDEAGTSHRAVRYGAARLVSTWAPPYFQAVVPVVPVSSRTIEPRCFLRCLSSALDGVSVRYGYQYNARPPASSIYLYRRARQAWGERRHYGRLSTSYKYFVQVLRTSTSYKYFVQAPFMTNQHASKREPVHAYSLLCSFTSVFRREEARMRQERGKKEAKKRWYYLLGVRMQADTTHILALITERDFLCVEHMFRVHLVDTRGAMCLR
jgi:hypothetical protein